MYITQAFYLNQIFLIIDLLVNYFCKWLIYFHVIIIPVIRYDQKYWNNSLSVMTHISLDIVIAFFGGNFVYRDQKFLSFVIYQVLKKFLGALTKRWGTVSPCLNTLSTDVFLRGKKSSQIIRNTVQNRELEHSLDSNTS